MEQALHARRPARLEDGELVAHPEALKTDCIAWFPVPEGADGGFEAEGVPAVRLDGDRVRLTGIPFFPYHAGLCDEVAVNERDGTIYAVEVVRAASELTVRVFHAATRLPTTSPGDDGGVRGGGPEDATHAPDTPGDPRRGTEEFAWWRVVRALSPHGIWFEQLRDDYTALSVPAAEWTYVGAFLDLKQRAGELQFEVATPIRVPA